MGLSPDPNAVRTTPPREVVLVGAGARARAWLAPLRHSARLRVVATVARSRETMAPDLPRLDSLAEALDAYPQAAFAVALPPRIGLETALLLAESQRSAIVEAPLHETLADADLTPAMSDVRVAHGWTTLPGLRAVRKLVQRASTGRLHIDVAGLPEQNWSDSVEGLVHALALVRTLLPDAAPLTVRQPHGGRLDVDLSDQKWTVSLRVHERGQRLEATIEGLPEAAVWTWSNDRESFSAGNRALIPSRPTPTAAVRALAQLLPDADRGDGLAEAAQVLRLTRDCLSRLPTRLAIGARPLQQSASIARRRPDDLLGRLGLRGELSSADAPPPSIARLTLPPEPFELWAFRAGVKPVAFLTVRPEDVDRTLQYFGDVQHERRERRVQVEAQDRWTDRRDQGEPRVELYIAHDAELARRAAYLQAEVDPTAALREIGALVGYPSCCVEAFAQQDDRSNNSRNRYHSQARTLSPDGSTQTPWPWELNNLHTMIVPFYPCSYRCQAALAWARSCLRELERSHPAFVQELRAVLSQPVLYFDHDHQIALVGKAATDRADYRAVALWESASPRLRPLAAAIGLGNQLVLDAREVVVARDGEIVLRLARTDPALGFIAPFGSE